MTSQVLHLYIKHGVNINLHDEDVGFQFFFDCSSFIEGYFLS